MKVTYKFGFIFTIISALILGGCKGGGGSSSSDAPAQTSPQTDYKSGFSGAIQKGPFIVGSRVEIQEYDNNMKLTGRKFVVETKDDLGSFDVPAENLNRYVEAIASGYFFNEVSGVITSEPTELKALIDLEATDRPTINILTTLQRRRMMKLINDGASFADAQKDSLEEVLRAFNIDRGLAGVLEAAGLDIAGTSEQDAVLTAASAVFMQAAKIAYDEAPFENGKKNTSISAQLTDMVNRLTSDIEQDGNIETNTADIMERIRKAGQQINLDEVRSNITTHYQKRGQEVYLPLFEEWVDKDGSGVLPQRRSQVASASFEDKTDADARVAVTSNRVRIAGLSGGESVSMEVSDFAKIVKNNVIQPTNNTTVRNGDVVRLQLLTGGFGTSQTVAVRIGTTEATWAVHTRKPELGYRTRTDGNYPFPQVDEFVRERSAYHAYPLEMSEAFTARYVATGKRYGCDHEPKSVAIHEDAEGVPGNELFRTNVYERYFTEVAEYVVKGSSVTQGDLEKLPVRQIKIGGEGIDLNAGDRVWLVFESPDVADCGNQYQNIGNGWPDFAEHMVSADGVDWSAAQNTSWIAFVVITD